MNEDDYDITMYVETDKAPALFCPYKFAGDKGHCEGEECMAWCPVTENLGFCMLIGRKDLADD